MQVRARVVISGIVQGVCFRYYAREKASEIGVNGWVKNRIDGKVETVFEGEREKVEEFIKWCGHGPSGARVTDVDVRWEDYSDEFNRFSIL